MDIITNKNRSIKAGDTRSKPSTTFKALYYLALTIFIAALAVIFGAAIWWIIK